MKTKHTPGPWIKADASPFVYALNKMESNRFYLSVQPGRGDCDLRVIDEELEANAQLIAAAPELLEALRGLVDGDSCYCHKEREKNGTFCDVCAAHNAIAKATGEQP